MGIGYRFGDIIYLRAISNARSVEIVGISLLNLNSSRMGCHMDDGIDGKADLSLIFIQDGVLRFTPQDTIPLSYLT